MNRFEEWRELGDRGSLVVLGLMSGTSADGVDGAVLRFPSGAGAERPEFLLVESRPYPEVLRAALLEAPRISLPELAALHAELGDVFGEMARECIEEARRRGAEVDLVASHGQTVFHHSGKGPPVSIQLGEADRLARTAGKPVVFDFRAADIAGGGEGAPLVPAGDLDLFGSAQRPLAILNLGGIANLTLLGPEEGSCMAWDVGPANCLSDELCRRRDPKGPGFDRDGELARSGKAQPALVALLLGHPFFGRPAPKSTGRETFGWPFLEAALSKLPPLSLSDTLASLATLLGQAVADDFGRLPAPWRPRRLLVAGGGLLNRAFMDELRHFLAPLPVESTQALGIHPQYREAACFAALGRRALLGLPGSFPSTTGVASPTILGKWAFPQS